MILVINHHCTINLDHILKMEVVQEANHYFLRLIDANGKAHPVASANTDSPIHTLYGDIHAHWGRGDGTYDLCRRADHLAISRQVEHAA